jgi:hypothetical protein
MVRYLVEVDGFENLFCVWIVDPVPPVAVLRVTREQQIPAAEAEQDH